MKSKTITLSAFAASAFAGSLTHAQSASDSDAFLGLTPLFDLRTRYEFRETDPDDPSHAGTARVRAGFQTGTFAGFSALAELEATYAFIDDYRSNPTGNQSTDPYVEGNSVIADPENFELNRAWVQYANSGFTAKVGRQRIIRNNAAFIGNVGWRQNEQTFDALSLGYKANDLTLSYAYSNNVLRIFGDDANDALPGPPLRDFEGDFHFFDASYALDGGQVGGYAYLIDVDNNDNVGRSNTFGAFYKCQGLHAEFAWQDGNSNLAGGDYDAFYSHLIYNKKAGGATYGIGLEYLEEDFKTPFATVHAYNGFADAFILQRIGLNKAKGYEGLADFYLSYVRPGLPCGLTFKGFAHYMMDDGFSDTYGYEFDAVLVKKFNDNLTGLIKGAYFIGDDGPANFEDIKQVTVDLTYKF